MSKTNLKTSSKRSSLPPLFSFWLSLFKSCCHNHGKRTESYSEYINGKTMSYAEWGSEVQGWRSLSAELGTCLHPNMSPTFTLWTLLDYEGCQRWGSTELLMKGSSPETQSKPGFSEVQVRSHSSGPFPGKPWIILQETDSTALVEELVLEFHCSSCRKTFS